MQVLVALAAAAPGVVSRRSLRDQVWGDEYVTEDAISAAVIRLRRAFDDDPRRPQVIQTVPRSGYRLIAPVLLFDDLALEAMQDGSVEVLAPSAPVARLATVVRVEIDVAEGAVDDPDGWLPAMREVVAEISRTAQHYGGWVREESSGVFAVFGVPHASEHHVEHALRAALELRELSGRLGETARGALRMGVASGSVVVAEQRAAPTLVHSPAVSTAMRLAQAARPHEVLMRAPGSSLRHVTVMTEALGEVVGVPYEVHRLCALQHATGVWEARQQSGLSTFRGRVQELDALLDGLRRSLGGRGQVISITGSPGVGKSRLLFELLTQARDRGVTTWVGEASPLDRRSPYYAWARLLGSVPSVADALSDDDDSSRVHDRLALDAVLHPEREDPLWTAIDPDVRYLRTVSSVVDTVVGDDQPCVIALEDIHWCDQASRALLEGVMRLTMRRRVLILVTRRPEGPDVPQASNVQSLWLDPLPPDAAKALLDDLVGDARHLSAWKEKVLADAGGTPLFLEECVRVATPQEELPTESTSRSVSAGSVPPRRLPSSVQALIAERIDRLPSPARQAVHAAAVLGSEADEALVRAVAGLADDDWTSALEVLHSSDLVYGTTARGRRALVFKHALTRDVAYRGIPADVRRELHRRASEQELTQAMTPEILAWHLAECGETDGAVEAFLRAARTASRAGAFDDALGSLQQATDLVANLPEGEERDRCELGLELARGAALVQTVGPTDAAVQSAYVRAEQLAETCGTPEQQFTAAWGTWFVHLMRGDLAQERRHGERIADLATRLDLDDALTLEAHHVQWSGLTLAGRPHLAAEHSEQGIARYDRTRHHWLTHDYGGHDPGVCALNLNAMASWLLGDVATARERIRDALALADELQHSYSILEASQAALVVSVFDRDADAVERLATRLIDLVDEGRLPEVTRGYAHGFIGAAEWFRGRPREAAVGMRDAVAVWQEFWGAWCFPLDGVFAEVLAADGDVAGAIAHVQQTLDWADESGGSWWSSELHRLRAALSRDIDLPAAADRIAEAQAAVVLAQAQGALMLELRAATTAVELAVDTRSRKHALRELGSVMERLPPQPDFRDLALARSALRDGG